MKKRKSEILGELNPIKSKFVANNTIWYKTLRKECIRLHETDVISVNKKTGIMTLNTGDWYTPTTKDRINRFQTRVIIQQKQGIWYVWNKNGNKTGPESIFYDGIRIDREGNVLNPRKNDREKDEIKTLIKQYCNVIKQYDKFPQGEKEEEMESYYYEIPLDKGEKGRLRRYLKRCIKKQVVSTQFLLSVLYQRRIRTFVELLYIDGDMWQNWKSRIAGEVENYLKRCFGIGYA